MAGSMFVMVAASLAGGNRDVPIMSPAWLIGTYFFVTMAEILISPMGQSFVSKVAPPRLAGLMMGGWFAATAAGSYGSGLLGKSYSALPHHSFFLILTGLLGLAAAMVAAFQKDTSTLCRLSARSGGTMSLISEKVRQAVGLLDEFDLDCWLTFTRESEINGDPVLPFLAPGPVTWHSAFIVLRDGRTRAIVGRYDQRTVQEAGVWDDVVAYVTGFKEPFQEFLKTREPADDRRQLLPGERDLRRPDLRHVPDAARRARARSGWPIGSSRPNARLGAARAQDGLRARADARGDPAHPGDLRPGRRLHPAGPDRAGDRRVHAGRGPPPRAGPRLGRRPPARPSSPAPTRPRRTTGRPAGPSTPGHVLNMDFGVRVDSLLLGHAADVLRPGARRDGRRRPTSARASTPSSRAVAESFAALKPGVARPRR